MIVLPRYEYTERYALLWRLTLCYQAKPVYLSLPTDIVYIKTARSRLDTPLDVHPPPNDPDVEEFVLDEIVNAVRAVNGDVVILVDACAVRHHVHDEVKELIEKTGFPVFSAPMGKTVVKENWERYGGVSFLCGNIPRMGTEFSADICRFHYT